MQSSSEFDLVFVPVFLHEKWLPGRTRSGIPLCKKVFSIKQTGRQNVFYKPNISKQQSFMLSTFLHKKIQSRTNQCRVPVVSIWYTFRFFCMKNGCWDEQEEEFLFELLFWSILFLFNVIRFPLSVLAGKLVFRLQFGQLFGSLLALINQFENLFEIFGFVLEKVFKTLHLVFGH